MSNTTQNSLSLIGRLLFASLFLPAGLSKIADFQGTVGYIGSVGLPFPEIGATIAILVEVLGSIALILGVQTKYAAAILALFTLAASIFFHNFWGVPADKAFIQQLMFFKNIAVVGGLLTIVAHGAGEYTISKLKLNFLTKAKTA